VPDIYGKAAFEPEAEIAPEPEPTPET